MDSLSKVVKHLKKKSNIFELIRMIQERYKSEKNKKLPLEVKGNNWVSGTELPIAIFIGFNPWKRDVFSGFFSEYRCAFTRGVFNWRRIEREFILELVVKEVTIVTWGAKPLPRSISKWQRRNRNRLKINHLKIEDGFLRSIGKGQLHTRPGSLCVDSSSIYFNAKELSDIEKLALSYDFSKDLTLLKRAETCIGLYNSAYLTKYYDVTLDSKFETFNRTDKYSILVVGQVEDDASIIYGKSKITRNTILVKKALKEHPNADIYFKPHPDYLAGNRRAKSQINKLAKVCVILPSDTNLNEVIRKVDHVYTITSLVGFEALLKGKKVTTLGAPFYSNWGLTDDRVKVSRRRKKELSLNELFATTMLLYPRYFHMGSDEKITFEEQSSFFIVEVLKYKNIFKLGDNQLYKNTVPYIDILSTPFKLLDYLITTELPSEADGNKVNEIINENFLLRDFEQISFLLIRTANYDALVDYTNLTIERLVYEMETGDINLKLLEGFLYSFKVTLNNTNGRVINSLPSMLFFFREHALNSKDYLLSFKHYIECCVLNIQYDLLSEAVDWISIYQGNTKLEAFELHQSTEDKIGKVLSLTFKPQYIQSLITVIKQKPSRSERNFNMRFGLISHCAHLYKNALLSTSESELLTDIKYYIAIDNHYEIQKNINSIPRIYGKDFIANELLNKKEINSWISIFYYLIKNKIKLSRYNVVDEYIKYAKKQPVTLQFANLHLAKLKSDFSKDFDYYLKQYRSFFKNNQRIETLYARRLRAQGKFLQSLKQYKGLHQSANTLLRKNSLEAEVAKVDFCIKSSDILNSIPQPKIPKGVIFIASQTCFNSLAMIIPSLVEAKKLGYAVVNLTEGMTENLPTGIECIDKYQGVIPLDLLHSPNVKDIENTWEINWDKKIVKSHGINFYQAFYERISTYVRKYHVDLKDPFTHKQFLNQLLRSDLALSICNNIYDELCINNCINVTFITSNSHVTPYSVFRDFARAKDNKHLGFINCNVAYESYFSNLGSKFSSTMCVTDMTLYPTIRAPFFARRDQFEPWFEKNKDNLEFKEQAHRLIKVNRVGSVTNDRELEIVELIKEKKAQGIKILCAFGKVPVDLNVPFDGGPAHEDMADWINHTVEVCSGSNKIFLIVKPHPHELKPQIALDLIGGFNDLVTGQPADNILFLGHKDINGHALAPYLDLALLYNGSTALELTAQGIPVMMAAYFGRYDYPVDLLYPKSRKDYKEFVLSCNYPQPTEIVREKSAYLMSYIGTDEISITNDYSLRQLTNDKVGTPTWREERVNHFLKNGDPKMKLVAQRIVEKFEKVPTLTH